MEILSVHHRFRFNMTGFLELVFQLMKRLHGNIKILTIIYLDAMVTIKIIPMQIFLYTVGLLRHPQVLSH